MLPLSVFSQSSAVSKASFSFLTACWCGKLEIVQLHADRIQQVHLCSGQIYNHEIIVCPVSVYIWLVWGINSRH